MSQPTITVVRQRIADAAARAEQVRQAARDLADQIAAERDAAGKATTAK